MSWEDVINEKPLIYKGSRMLWDLVGSGFGGGGGN